MFAMFTASSEPLTWVMLAVIADIQAAAAAAAAAAQILMLILRTEAKFEN